MLSIIIPVYNEAATVVRLLDQVWLQSLPIPKELVIIESNSTDGSRALVQSWVGRTKSQDPGASISLLQQPVPRGKGNAVREGLAAARGTYILIQDGDLEYDVSDYPALLQPLIEGKTRFVLGSRHLSAGDWKIREFAKEPWKAILLNFGGILFHGLFNVLFGTKLTDPTTMYKVFRRDCLEHFTLTGNRFDLDFELVGKLIRAGFPPLEIPVGYRSRSYAEGKKIRIIHDPLLWIRIMFKTRFTPLK